MPNYKQPVREHEHQWRWNDWYIEDGGDPVYCFVTGCSAKLTMSELIERANAVEQIKTFVEEESDGKNS